MSEDKDKAYWIEEQQLSMIDPDLVDKWGDPNKHPETQLSKDEQQQLLVAGEVRRRNDRAKVCGKTRFASGHTVYLPDERLFFVECLGCRSGSQ